MASTKKGRRSRIRWIAAAVIAAAAVAGGSMAAMGSTGTAYRTAVAGNGQATQTLDVVGTITPSNMANVSFPISGQVETVSVTVGQKVTKGERLASLNTTSLASAVNSAAAALASAQAQLASDQAAQSSSSSSTSTSSATTAKLATSPNLSSLQAAVTLAQRRLTTDLAQASSSLKQAETACQPTSSSPSPSPSPTASATASPTPSASPTPTPSSTPSSGVDCTTAMQNALQAQTRASNDARALAAAQSALVRALQQSASHATTSSAATPSTTSARGTSASSGASSGGQVTAAQITSDEASIQSAEAQVAAAKQNLTAAQLSSPIAGTVAAVNVVPGQSVTATPSTPQFVIVGPGVDEVTTTVGASSIGSLKVGSPATITLDGSTNKLAGHVSSIGSLGTTSSSTTTYPVTISFDSPTTGLLNGANADVQIVLSQAASSVTLPTSAVHTTGSIRTVTVLQKGKPVTVQITVGTIGPDLTQVLSGVKAGDVVVLADMATPLPTANTNTRALTGGGGGLGTIPRTGTSAGTTRPGG